MVKNKDTRPKEKCFILIAMLFVLVVALLAIYATIDSDFYGLIRLTSVSLVRIENEKYISLGFNLPAKGILAKTRVNRVSDGLGWVGETKQDLSFLGDNLVKILIFDIDVARRLRDMDKNIIQGNLGFVALDSDVKYMITHPPDDATTAIYIGSDNNAFAESLVTHAWNKNILLIKIRD